MSDVAIKVEGLGKQFRIGKRERYKTFRDTLANIASAPIRLFQKRVEDPETILWALRDVSFEVKKGEAVGIIGRNGAGKSTLLKVLSRITEPTEGQIAIEGRIGSLLEVGTGFHPELTGRENIFMNGAILGMRRAEIVRKFDEMVEFAEVERFIDTPVKRYSSGMYTRLAFAVAAHLEPEILIVDEVLAVGDAAFQRKCLGKMSDVAKCGRTVLFVSHNMGAIMNLCQQGVVLSRGKVCYNGPTQEAVRLYNGQTSRRDRAAGFDCPHVLFEATQDGDDPALPCRIIRIEMLDLEGNPKPILSTWEDVIFRFRYTSDRFIKRGSVVLEITTVDGVHVLLLSTHPDGTLEMPIEPGEHEVDCVIRKLPFAAGEFIVGAGLAIPQAEWLFRRPDIARLTVHPADVYGSGMAPKLDRSMMAVEHSWRTLG